MFLSGLVSVSFRRISPEEIVRIAARAKLSSIEWGGDIHLPPGDPKLARRILALTEAAGLRVSSYGSYFRIGITPVEQFASVLATASALSAPIVRIWAYDRHLPPCAGNLWDDLVRQGAEVARMAERAGICVCLECHNHTLTEEYHSALTFLQAVSSPALRMYWQPNEKRDFDYNKQALKALTPYVEGIHVFHWDECRHYPLATGFEEWRAYLSILRECAPKKQIPLLLEFMPDNQAESLPTEADTLRQLINEVCK
ncbi:MAG: sugar phosphate isomerase/epimerase [Clostridia bacterium]|nr:sugar phosphate isomerase/epimerase [Clostridia bacterium]